ncbi:MAG TPA: Type 1 glutamine amidotransferase-like domain-containing protein [Actinomycetales bacterium]|jgi:cyanophycinase
MRGPVALVGSGEYLPVLEQVEAALIAGRPPRFVQLATAAAPEGQASLARWHALGLDSARRLGVEQVVLPVVDRVSADDPALASLVEGAGLVYLSGGNPGFLAETLHGTRVWAAIEAAWRGGSALAGCSAGAMALGGRVAPVRNPWREAPPGLALVPGVEVLPHFDRFAGRLPDRLVDWLASAPDDVAVLGVDEDTAVVWDERTTQWTVRGRQGAWLLGRDGRTGYAAGEVVPLPQPAG